MLTVRCFRKKIDGILIGGNIMCPVSPEVSKKLFLKVRRAKMVFVLHDNLFVDDFQYVEVNSALLSKISVLSFDSKSGEIQKIVDCPRNFTMKRQKYAELILTQVKNTFENKKLNLDANEF
jgi:hypothetical protein